MSAQLTLTRSSSLVSTTSTLVGSKEEAKSSKLSLAPSQNGLVDLEKQALATSVPTVGILEKFVSAKKSITSTAQKAASMLTKPKAAVVKQAKTEVPVLDLESQLPVQTGEVNVKNSSAHPLTKTHAGSLIGATFGFGSTITSLAVLGAFSRDPLMSGVAAFTSVAASAIGGIAGATVQLAIQDFQERRSAQ